MTEEIIIDGVNVAGCGYFCETDKECNICGMGTSGEDTFCRDCKDNSNCYYKQFKRLEFELKITKADYEASEQENKELLKARNHFMAENLKYFNALEEINLILDELKQQYDYMTDYSEIKEIQDKINEVLK